MGNGGLGQVDLFVDIRTIKTSLAFLYFFQNGQTVGVGQGFRNLFCFFASIKMN
jgi:hypothetical protein